MVSFFRKLMYICGLWSLFLIKAIYRNRNMQVPMYLMLRRFTCGLIKTYPLLDNKFYDQVDYFYKKGGFIMFSKDQQTHDSVI